VTVDSEGRWIDGVEYTRQTSHLRSFAELTFFRPQDTIVSLQTESGCHVGLYMGIRIDEKICDGADGSIEFQMTDNVEPIRVNGSVSRVWGQRHRLLLSPHPQMEIIGFVSKAADDRRRNAEIGALIERYESQAAV
jgi:hypothetical protein